MRLFVFQREFREGPTRLGLLLLFGALLHPAVQGVTGVAHALARAHAFTAMPGALLFPNPRDGHIDELRGLLPRQPFALNGRSLVVLHCELPWGYC